LCSDLLLFQQVDRYFPMPLSLKLRGNRGSLAIIHAASLLVFVALVCQGNPYFFCQEKPYRIAAIVADTMNGMTLPAKKHHPQQPGTVNPAQNKALVRSRSSSASPSAASFGIHHCIAPPNPASSGHHHTPEPYL